jgi:acetylcholinesterase
MTAADSQPSYDAIVNSTGCASSPNTLDCLRRVPVDDFIAATNKSVYVWTPVVDGVFLKDLPTRLLKRGKHIRVPLLLGRTLPLIISPRSFLPPPVQKTRTKAYPLPRKV